ncbi:MAG TPA: nucleoside hydrolase, partial [Armatimonadota bacterium]|nr:nucleoside hydrolase [Armatimonadota bacterium]
AAARVMESWPTPILLSGGEIGARVFTGKRLHTETSADNPVRVAYAHYIGVGKDRESWDQTAVLAAVRGAAAHWTASAPGTVAVASGDATNRWTPTAEGRHTYLIERDPPACVKEAIEDLMVRPPGRPERER